MEEKSRKKQSKHFTDGEPIGHRIFEIIQIGSGSDVVSRIFDVFISIVIIVNISVLFLETFDELSEWMPLFSICETVTILVFCVEYVLRIWTAKYLYPNETTGKAIFKFLVSYDGIVDLLTILPFFFLTGAVVFRMLRVARILHLFRINTKYDSFDVIGEILYSKRNQLASSLFIIFILMMGSSLCIYSVEHQVQPEAFKNAFSGIWWSMSTMLTVGYGDIYPVTFLGQAMAIVISVLGVGLVAIPTGIISAGFVEYYNKLQTERAIRSDDRTYYSKPLDISSKKGSSKRVIYSRTSRSIKNVSNDRKNSANDRMNAPEGAKSHKK